MERHCLVHRHNSCSNPLNEECKNVRLPVRLRQVSLQERFTQTCGSSKAPHGSKAAMPRLRATARHVCQPLEEPLETTPYQAQGSASPQQDTLGPEPRCLSYSSVSLITLSLATTILIYSTSALGCPVHQLNPQRLLSSGELEEGAV